MYPNEFFLFRYRAKLQARVEVVGDERAEIEGSALGAEKTEEQ